MAEQDIVRSRSQRLDAVHKLVESAPCCERAAILDGNVKRVLARYHGIEGWPGLPKVEKQLWAIAGSLLPEARLADYTQAQMDLGATVGPAVLGSVVPALGYRGMYLCAAGVLLVSVVYYWLVHGRGAGRTPSPPTGQIPVA